VASIYIDPKSQIKRRMCVHTDKASCSIYRGNSNNKPFYFTVNMTSRLKCAREKIGF